MPLSSKPTSANRSCLVCKQYLIRAEKWKDFPGRMGKEVERQR